MGLVIVSALFIANFTFAEFLVKLGVSPEKTRRLVHITAGFLAALLPYFVNFKEAIILGVFFILALAFTKRRRLLRSIHGIKRKGLGAVFFPAGLLIAAILFWKSNVQLFQTSALMLSLADGFAGIIGEKFGKHPYCLTGPKTIEGSFVFWLTAFLIFVGLLRVNHSFSPERYRLVLFASFVLTLLEGFLGGGLDNLAIPVATGLLGALLL